MFPPSGPDLVIIFVVALLIFGPKKLPEIGRQIGQGLREFKKASQSLMDEIEHAGDAKPAPAVDQMAEITSEESKAIEAEYRAQHGGEATPALAVENKEESKPC